MPSSSHRAKLGPSHILLHWHGGAMPPSDQVKSLSPTELGCTPSSSMRLDGGPCTYPRCQIGTTSWIQPADQPDTAHLALWGKMLSTSDLDLFSIMWTYMWLKSLLEEFISDSFLDQAEVLFQLSPSPIRGPIFIQYFHSCHGWCSRKYTS